MFSPFVRRTIVRKSLAPQRPRRRKLRIEPLESRRMLSVTATLDSGDDSHLLVDGDQYENDIRVTRRRMGDVTVDGTIDIFDTNYVSAYWGTTGPNGDANDDGIIDIFDVNLVSSNWGTQQIDVHSGTTFIDSFDEIGDDAITLISIAGGDEDDVILVDANLRTIVEVDGEGDDDLLKITGNRSGADTLTIDAEEVTLLIGTKAASFSNVESVEFDLFEHPTGGQVRTDHVTVKGSSGDDTIVAEDTTVTLESLPIELTEVEALSLDGDAGDDVLDATYVDGVVVLTLIGDDGNDILMGGEGNDQLSGGDGNDILAGHAGNDSLTGGADDDRYVFMPVAGGDLGSDEITEANTSDADTLDFQYLMDVVDIDLSSTSTQTDVVTGVLDLHLTSSTGIENVIGGGGNDVVIGNSRYNVLDGRGGDDEISGSDGDDLIFGGDDDDVLEGDAGSDTLFGGLGQDMLFGGDNDDWLYGEEDLDELYGEGGADFLEGGFNDDHLEGGSGNDTYYYRWLLGRDSLGSDTIEEASMGGTDTVDFTDYLADDYTAPNPATSGAQEVTEDVLEVTFNPTSQVENVIDPDTDRLQISSIAVSAGASLGQVTLTASGVPLTTEEVAFYIDTNQDGQYDDGTDTILSTDEDASDGFSIVADQDDLDDVGTIVGVVVIDGGGDPLGPGTEAPFSSLSPTSNDPSMQTVVNSALNATFVRDPNDADINVLTGQYLVFAEDSTNDFVQFTDEGDVDSGRFLAGAIAGGNSATIQDAGGGGSATVFPTTATSAVTADQPGLGVDGYMVLGYDVEALGADGAASAMTRAEVFSDGDHEWQLTARNENFAVPTEVTVRGDLIYDFFSFNHGPSIEEGGVGRFPIDETFEFNLTAGENELRVQVDGGAFLILINLFQQNGLFNPLNHYIKLSFIWTFGIGSFIRLAQVNAIQLNGLVEQPASPEPPGQDAAGTVANALYVSHMEVVSWSYS